MRKTRALGTPAYSEGQTKWWLAWLARGMVRDGQTIFRIEGLQPTWLTRPRQRRLYFLLTRVLWAICVGLTFTVGLGAVGFASKLSAGVTQAAALPQGPSPLLTADPRVTILFGLLFGMVLGLFVGIWDALRSRRLTLVKEKRRPREAAWILAVSVGISIVSFEVLSLLLTLIRTASSTGETPDWWGTLGIAAPLYGTFFGLTALPFWIARRLGRSSCDDIQTVESVGLAWGQLLGMVSSSLLGTALWVAILGTIDLYRIGDLSFDSLTGWLRTLQALVMIVILGLFLGFLRCLRPGLPRSKVRPNQGMWLSLRSSLTIGLVAGAIAGVVGAGVGLRGTEGSGAGDYVAYGVVTAVCLGAWYGGLDVLQHLILRTLLAAGGGAPLHLARFLDYAAEELHFLRKVGGGYIFMHRSLLEHFAGLQGPDEGGLRSPTSRGTAGEGSWRSRPRRRTAQVPRPAEAEVQGPRRLRA